MHNLSKQIASFAMILLYLLATVGFGIYSCNHQEKQEFILAVSLFEKENCANCLSAKSSNQNHCADKQKENNCCSKPDVANILVAAKTDCCSVHFAFFDSKTNIPSPTFNAVKILSTDMLFNHIAPLQLSLIAPVAYPIEEQTNAPPDIYGKTLAVYHYCQLII